MSNNIKYTTSYLPTKHIWLKRIGIALLIIMLLLIMIYPYEFGTLIGIWVDNFKNGFTDKNIFNIWQN